MMTYALPESYNRSKSRIDKFLSLCGSHSLAYHSLQPELSHFQTKTGYLAYIDFQNETIVLGDPISGAENAKELVLQFLQFRPQCSFIQVSRKTCELLAELDFTINHFGVESQIDLPFNITGKQKKEVRLLVNAAIRNNISVREILKREELFYLTSYKTQNKNNRFRFGLHADEFSFLARPINDTDEKDVRIFGGFQNNRLVNYSLFDPMYYQDKIIGYAEVISRQIDHSPKGGRAYTLIQAMHKFTDEKIQFVNIGLLPFYKQVIDVNDFKGKSNSLIDMIFSGLYNSSPLVSNFSGLSFHKSRYRGNLLPRYFATNSKRPYKALLSIFKLTTGKWLPRIHF